MAHQIRAAKRSCSATLIEVDAALKENIKTPLLAASIGAVVPVFVFCFCETTNFAFCAALFALKMLVVSDALGCGTNARQWYARRVLSRQRQPGGCTCRPAAR